jgi:hypothetical protein
VPLSDQPPEDLGTRAVLVLLAAVIFVLAVIGAVLLIAD